MWTGVRSRAAMSEPVETPRVVVAGLVYAGLPLASLPTLAMAAAGIRPR